MPMSDSVLSGKILKSIIDFIKSMAPDAVPREFQKTMADAIAKGVIKSLKKAKAVATVSAGTKIEASMGITGTDPASMVTVAQGVFMVKNGSIGVAMIPIFTAIFAEIVIHLANVKVESISGFGGAFSVGNITAISKGVVLDNIMKELPPDVKVKLLATPAGKIMFEAIATGFVTDLLAKGIPAPIPASGGDSTGIAIARFS